MDPAPLDIMPLKEHLASYLLPQNSANLAGKKEDGYWRGFAEVWYRATQLNRYVIEALHEADIPIMAIQPSASIVSKNGVIKNWELSPLELALEAGIVPVIYGDMAFDSVKGGACTFNRSANVLSGKSSQTETHFAGRD